MELRHLRYFIAAAEEEHFGRAADRLCITRPAVSQLVADLEAELGTPLFQRLAHRVKLTAAGHTLLPRLQTVMKDLNEALLLAGLVGQGKTGTLNIGYGTLTLLHKLFRATIKRYCELYPDVTLSLFEMSTTDQPKALAEQDRGRAFVIIHVQRQGGAAVRAREQRVGAVDVHLGGEQRGEEGPDRIRARRAALRRVRPDRCLCHLHRHLHLCQRIDRPRRDRAPRSRDAAARRMGQRHCRDRPPHLAF